MPRERVSALFPFPCPPLLSSLFSLFLSRLLAFARSLASLVLSFFPGSPSRFSFSRARQSSLSLSPVTSTSLGGEPGCESVPGVFLGASRCLSQAGDALAERAKNVATRTRLFPSLLFLSLSSPPGRSVCLFVSGLPFCLPLSTSLIHERFRYRRSYFLGAKGCTE